MNVEHCLQRAVIQAYHVQLICECQLVTASVEERQQCSVWNPRRYHSFYWSKSLCGAQQRYDIRMLYSLPYAQLPAKGLFTKFTNTIVQVFCADIYLLECAVVAKTALYMKPESLDSHLAA